MDASDKNIATQDEVTYKRSLASWKETLSNFPFWLSMLCRHTLRLQQQTIFTNFFQTSIKRASLYSHDETLLGTFLSLCLYTVLPSNEMLAEFTWWAFAIRASIRISNLLCVYVCLSVLLLKHFPSHYVSCIFWARKLNYMFWRGWVLPCR